MSKLICLRGLPGSGKTTLAYTLSGAVYSADDFFMVPGKGYCFDPSKLSLAHGTCFKGVLTALRGREAVVVVDNTNLSAWEISPYALAAQAYDYEFEVVTLECDPEAAFARQTHGVPRLSFDRMVGNLEKRDLLPWWSHRYHWSVVAS